MNAKEIYDICSKITTNIFVYSDGESKPDNCEVVIVDKNTPANLGVFMQLRNNGWKIFKGDKGYTYVKNDDVFNALKNPESVQIPLGKKPETAIIEEQADLSTLSVKEIQERARDDYGRFVADDPTTPQKEAWTNSIHTERARDKNGKYIADDPKTPQNEAWTNGSPFKYKTQKRNW
jgi:hypothetical protein